MKRLIGMVSLSGWLGASLATAGEPMTLVPGREAGVAIPSTRLEMKVRLPGNYAPDRTWPAVFVYHGANGQPSASILEAGTDGRDYIMVGMPYAEAGEKQRTAAELKQYLREELENLGKARAWLKQNAKLDDRAVYVGGVSKGGWIASAMGEQDAASVAGIVILLAGRAREPLSVATASGLRGKAIYIGAGELDPNLLSARCAERAYREAGATVTMDDYPGIGHEMPQDLMHLRAWFGAREWSRQKPVPASVLDAAGQAFQRALDDARTEADPMTRYQKIRDVADDPRVPLCGAGIYPAAQKLLTELRGQSPVKEEWTAETTFCNLAWRESRVKSLAELKMVKDGFSNLAQGFSQTRYGKRAVYYFEQFDKAYAKSVEATEKANASAGGSPAPAGNKRMAPSFPTSGASDGRMQVTREGDKTIYKRCD